MRVVGSWPLGESGLFMNLEKPDDFDGTVSSVYVRFDLKERVVFSVLAEGVPDGIPTPIFGMSEEEFGKLIESSEWKSHFQEAWSYVDPDNECDILYLSEV